MAVAPAHDMPLSSSRHGQPGRRPTMSVGPRWAALLASFALACLTPALAETAETVGTDCYDGPQGYISILASDTVIDFGQMDPLGVGWVEAMLPHSTTLDTAWFRVSTCRLNVVAQYSVGGDLHQVGGPDLMPLEIAVRVKGRGRWANGASFCNSLTWTPWTAWRACTDTSPATGTILFDADQTFSVEFKARTKRSGLSDLAGTYQQTPHVTLTLSQGGCHGTH